MARPTPEEILSEPFIRPAKPVRPCDHPGCTCEGEHRAPVSRDRLFEYYWFCLEHVRAYNRTWDYFRGMSEAEIERQRRADTVWGRPSWPFHGAPEPGRRYYRVHDGFAFFWDEEPYAGTAPPRGPVSEQQAALAVLELEEPVTFEEIKRRYKVLAKQLHPDANGGDRAAEERLKIVNQAYSTLKLRFD